MDLPDIKIVVQWKATCDLLSLWQRFGRAARGQDQTGTAILLVEKKDTDENRALKAEKAEKRKEKEKQRIGTKRKATHQLTHQAKRPALQDHNLNTIPSSREDIEDQLDVVVNEEAAGEDLLKEERRKHYTKREGQQTISTGSKGKGKDRIVIVGSVIDDFINSPFDCRRIVPMLYFGNDKRGK
jgi:superfamily II DNA/RNA helicase